MKKIAIIGSTGQLGTDLIKVFEKGRGYKVFPLSHKDIEVTNKSGVEKVLGKIKPDFVINTAAFHNLELVEEDPDKAFLVNGIAQKYLAEFCEKIGCTFVFFSTDYVFGGYLGRKKPYEETDITSPVNVYGVSKVAGEQFVSYLSSKYFIVRVSGLFGAAGPSGKGLNFVDLMIKLGKERGAVKVKNDEVTAPTYTKNIAENLRTLLSTKKYGIYHMVSEGYCSWWEFAAEIFKQLDMDVDCEPVASSYFPSPVTRPSFSALKNHNLKKLGINRMLPWKDNLRLYLVEKGYLS